MLDRLKNGSTVLFGFLIGVALALPLFWFGVKQGVGALEGKARYLWGKVEVRQQAMADEALRCEQNLVKLGWKGMRRHKDRFARTELLRSRLAGTSPFEEKIEISQDLERSLLEAEKTAFKAARESAAVAKDPWFRNFVADWDTQKRYLVDEEMRFAHAVKHYNGVLHTWPVPLIVSHKTFASLVGGIFAEIRSNLSAWIRQFGRWIGYVAKWAWAKVRGKDSPEYPKPVHREQLERDPLFDLLPEPFYIAEAPLPEEDYREIQYDREVPSMADVETGEDAPHLQNPYREPFVAPVPTVQKTVAY